MNPAIEFHLGAIALGSPPTPRPPRDPGSRTAQGVHALNRLLRYELGAINAYRRAAAGVGRMDVVVFEVEAGVLLRTLLEGHQERADALQRMVLAKGARPATHAGIWNILMGMAESATSWFDARVMTDTLRQVEEQGVATYRRELPLIDQSLDDEIETELLPAQERALAAYPGALATVPDDAT